MDEPIRVVVFGAHPDDDDIKTGGTAALWSDRGDDVLFLSLTNGDAGHQSMAGGELARRRRAEAESAARELGRVRYRVLDNHDGALIPSLDLRSAIIAIIREHQADLVLLPRPWDYHPDHRATAQVVQDAAYMVTVPNVAAFATHLRRNPVFAYVSDHFTRPCPFRPDVAVDTTPVVERKLRALHCHTSQVYEWLPYNGGNLAEVPADEPGRLRWLRRWLEGDARNAKEHQETLAHWYGPLRAPSAQYAEAFEICELGRQPDQAEIRRLFPLPPKE